MLMAILAGWCVFFFISKQVKKPTDESEKAKWWLAVAIGIVVGTAFMNPLSTIPHSDVVGRFVVRFVMILILCIPILIVYFLHRKKAKKRGLNTDKKIEEPVELVESSTHVEKPQIKATPESNFYIVFQTLTSLVLLFLKFILSLIFLLIKHIRK